MHGDVDRDGQRLAAGAPGGGLLGHFVQQPVGQRADAAGLLGKRDKRPYRLEMGTKFANAAGKDLYAFWGDTLTEALNALLAEHDSRVLVNLASDG